MNYRIVTAASTEYPFPNSLWGARRDDAVLHFFVFHPDGLKKEGRGSGKRSYDPGRSEYQRIQTGPGRMVLFMNRPMWGGLDSDCQCYVVMLGYASHVEDSIAHAP